MRRGRSTLSSAWECRADDPPGKPAFMRASGLASRRLARRVHPWSVRLTKLEEEGSIQHQEVLK